MKKIVTGRMVLVLVFLVVPVLLFAGETVPSQIKEVIIFSDQALVKRTATIKVEKQLYDLFLESEAFSVDKDFVSARIFGEGEILSVQFKDVYLIESAQENIRITPEPTEKNYQDREGVFLWGLGLKPGEKREIDIEFAISYPKDWPVAGL